jgi:IS30 family transposase
VALIGAWIKTPKLSILPVISDLLNRHHGCGSVKLKVGWQTFRRKVVSLPRAPLTDKRLRLGDYTADVVISKREEHCCYFVIQRAGSAEMIEMQRFDDPDEAEAAANAALRRWNEEDELRQYRQLTFPRKTR